MSLTLNLGQLQDATQRIDVPMGILDALKVTQNTGTLVKYANTESPLNAPSNVKIATTRIPNIYATLAKGAIPPGKQAFSTSGTSVFVELNLTATKVAAEDGLPDVLLPMVCRVELRLPNDEEITDLMIRDIIGSTLAPIGNGSGGTRVLDIMRGVISFI